MKVRSRATSFLLVAVSVANGAMAFAAEAPDLSGTWKLDESASTIDPAVVFTGLGGHVAGAVHLPGV